MRAAIALAVVSLLACKGDKAKPAEETAHGSGSSALPPIEVDWKACDKALAAAATAPLDARPQILIDGCKVCGDWSPLLRWSTPHPEGGPKESEIEAALARCGVCDGNAKMRFMGTLDKARGTDARTPWRQLGEICKDKVSAVPDTRFSSAPFYALDRIARTAGARGGETATKLAAIEVPLPALSIAGTGVALPDVDNGVSPKISALQITVLGDSVYIGRMPRAHLGAGGVQVELGDAGYPGALTKLEDLGPALKKLVGDDATNTITLLAPHAMPAEKLVPFIAAAAPIAPLYLAANAHESPEGWQLVGAIPVQLTTDAKPEIAVTGEMTVQNLATELGKRAGQHVSRVGVSAPR